MELGDLLHEQEFRKCKGPENATNEQLLEAFSYFCAQHWHIRHPEQGRIRFVLREAQTETVEAWLAHRSTVVLKARQIGFSSLAAAYAFWLTYFWPDRLIIMLSRTEREAGKLLAKTKYGYRLLPVWMKQRGPELLSDNLLRMIFSNDSSIESLPSGNDPARGESVFLVIVDEMAFLPNPGEAWSSIEPIYDVGGKVICLSTANGIDNIFYELWVGSQTHAGVGADFFGIFFPWSATPDRDEKWYEAKAKTLPGWQLAQEYPSNPEEAFIRSGRPVFDLDSVRDLMVEEPSRGYLDRDKGGNLIFREDGGPLAIWDLPNESAIYVIGADVAEGLQHGDYSSAHVIDAESGDVVADWHGHVDADIFGEEILSRLGLFYNRCLVGVESNNHGLTTLKGLQRAKYPNIYLQRKLTDRNVVLSEALGWRTTQVSKPLAIDELNGAIRDGNLYLACASTIAELLTFVRDSAGKMHGSPHDDRVMSLAIAVQMLKYVWLPEYRQKQKIKKNTFAWWERVFEGDDRKKQPAIGSFNVRDELK